PGLDLPELMSEAPGRQARSRYGWVLFMVMVFVAACTSGTGDQARSAGSTGHEHSTSPSSTRAAKQPSTTERVLQPGSIDASGALVAGNRGGGGGFQAIAGGPDLRLADGVVVVTFPVLS